MVNLREDWSPCPSKSASEGDKERDVSLPGRGRLPPIYKDGPDYPGRKLPTQKP